MPLGGDRVLWLGVFLVMLAFAAWIFGEFVQRGRKYKVIAIWDRKKPFLEEKPPFIPAKGDIVSDDTVKIEINAGQTIKNVSVQCINPIK